MYAPFREAEEDPEMLNDSHTIGSPIVSKRNMFFYLSMTFGFLQYYKYESGNSMMNRKIIYLLPGDCALAMAGTDIVTIDNKMQSAIDWHVFSFLSIFLDSSIKSLCKNSKVGLGYINL